jgi:hypothetical protein
MMMVPGMFALGLSIGSFVFGILLGRAERRTPVCRRQKSYFDYQKCAAFRSIVCGSGHCAEHCAEFCKGRCVPRTEEAQAEKAARQIKKVK